MSYQISAKSKQGNMIKLLETDAKVDAWYFLKPEVATFVRNFSVGDTVEFQASKDVENMVGKNTITFIKKIAGATPVPTPVAGVSAMGTDKTVIDDPRKGTEHVVSATQKPGFPKYGSQVVNQQAEAEKSERIARLSIASSTSTAMAALTGSLDQASLIDMWSKMYKQIYDTVMGK